MKINIKPFHNNKYTYDENSIACLTSWLNRNYFMIFKDLWNFNFINKNKLTNNIGKRIVFYEKCNLFYLDYYHGIKLTKHDTVKCLDVVGYITNELNNGHPVLLLIDVFWLPWCDDYQKQHQLHYCLALGHKHNNIICLENHFDLKDREVILPISNLIKSLDSFYTYEISKRELILSNWRELTDEILYNLAITDSFNDMRNFAKVFEREMDLEIEFSGYEDTRNLWKIPLIHRILQISNGRYKFSNVVEYIAKNTNCIDLLLIADEFFLVAEKWYIISKLIFKGYIKSDIKLLQSKIADRIRDLADCEESLACKLSNI
ncbi:MAG: hypothetical protein KAX49_06360 [Halanaerobiales bacterium]|nr:hypothetical protein [Halanaerobiales bacterium]